MESQSRGLVLIINNEQFKKKILSPSKKQPRAGSQLDVDRLKKVFGDLEFKVICNAKISLNIFVAIKTEGLNF
jgi:hypothetical protein